MHNAKEEITAFQLPSGGYASLNGDEAKEKNPSDVAAQGFFSNQKHQTKSLSWTQTILAWLTSGFAAGASSSSSYAFIKHLVDQFPFSISDETKTILAGGITSLAMPIAFLLAFNANFLAWNRIFRGAPHLKCDDLKRNAIAVAITLLSIVASFKLNWDAFEDAPTPIRLIVSLGRLLSSGLLNFIFTEGFLRDFRKDNEHVVFLKGAQTELKEKSKNPEEFIKHLDNTQLFNHLKNTQSHNSIDQVNTIFKALKHNQAIPKSNNVLKACTYTTSLFAIAPNFFRVGQSVVSTISNPYVYWGLSITFGGPSALVNTAIAAINAARAIKNLCDKECPKSCKDMSFSILKTFLICGYGATNAGISLFYPYPVENTILNWTQAILNFLICVSIGDTSFDKFVNDAKIRYLNHKYNHLLEGAKNASSLQNYYSTLNDSEKPILVKLLNNYCQTALDSMINFFYCATPQILALFPKPTATAPAAESKIDTDQDSCLESGNNHVFQPQ